jgi:hypothetical protein
LERPAAREHATGHAPTERLQPLQQRAIGVDRDAPQVLDEPGLGALVGRLRRTSVPGRGAGQERSQPALVAQLDDDRAQAALGRRQSERGGDRRLAHATLAGDDHQLALED